MVSSVLPLIGSGFLLGWSVAWPPGPINTEIARRCLARGFWAGFSLLLGACSADALWALLVALGLGLVFTGPLVHQAMAVVSVLLLAVLMVAFLRRALAAWKGGAGAAAPARFDSARAGYLLGATMALTSPWNVTFWLAAMGRPGLAGLGLPALLLTVAAVLAGALTWGLCWSATVVLLHRRLDLGGRWGGVAMNGATALLMGWFILGALQKML